MNLQVKWQDLENVEIGWASGQVDIGGHDCTVDLAPKHVEPFGGEKGEDYYAFTVTPPKDPALGMDDVAAYLAELVGQRCSVEEIDVGRFAIGYFSDVNGLYIKVDTKTGKQLVDALKEVKSALIAEGMQDGEGQ